MLLHCKARLEKSNLLFFVDDSNYSKITECRKKRIRKNIVVFLHFPSVFFYFLIYSQNMARAIYLKHFLSQSEYFCIFHITKKLSLESNVPHVSDIEQSGGSGPEKTASRRKRFCLLYLTVLQVYQKPCWHIASATFLKPAMFAPLT